MDEVNIVLGALAAVIFLETEEYRGPFKPRQAGAEKGEGLAAARGV